MAYLWLIGEHHGVRLQHELTGEEASVGRGSDNDLVLPSQTVSRHHARLRLEGDRIIVADLGSLNGTRINGNGVEGEATAQPGDTVEFGSVMLMISDAAREPSTVAPLLSDDQDISKSVFLSREEVSSAANQRGVADPAVFRLLTEAGQLLVVPESEEGTFDRILELVEKTIPADRILLLVREKPEGDPVQRAARMHGDRAISRLMLSRTMVRMVLDEGAAILTSDAQADERFMNQQSVVAQDLRSAMAVPLVHHEEMLGLIYVDTSDPVTTYQEDDLRVLTLLGQMLGAKVANARLLEIARERERLEEELKTAARIQQRLLPQKLPEIEGYEIMATQTTCEAVGGDLYDAGEHHGRLQFCLGDVSGKGIGAALLMSDVLASMRTLRPFDVTLPDLVARLDRHVLRTTQPEHYLTLFIAEIDPQNHRLEYVNAGHPPAFLLKADGTCESLGSTGMPVGLVDLPTVTFGSETVDFPPGSTLVIYSDGVSEAERGEEQFGDHRFEAILTECHALSADDCAERIEAEVDRYLGDRPRTDDLTLFLLRRRA